MYCEDFDLMHRIHRVAKNIYYTNISIIHNHVKESYKNFKMLITHIKSAIKYFNKFGWFFDKERKQMNNKILKETKEMNSVNPIYEKSRRGVLKYSNFCVARLESEAVA